jgi:hypothetical protein
LFHRIRQPVRYLQRILKVLCSGIRQKQTGFHKREISGEILFYWRVGNGVTVGNLADYADDKATEEYLNKLVNYENDVFVPFNNLMFEDGAFIHLEKGAKAEAPIQVLNLYTDAKIRTLQHPECWLLLKKNLM